MFQISSTPFTEAFLFFSTHDLHVQTVQFCNQDSAVISTGNFLDTSVGGDNAFALSIHDLVGFPQFVQITIRLLNLLGGDNAFAFSIHDLVYQVYYY